MLPPGKNVGNVMLFPIRGHQHFDRTNHQADMIENSKVLHTPF